MIPQVSTTTRHTLFERHVFDGGKSPSGRDIKVLLHIWYSAGSLTIGEGTSHGEMMRFLNQGEDIACGPFHGSPEDIAAFQAVYSEALQYGRERLAAVKPAETTPEP